MQSPAVTQAPALTPTSISGRSAVNAILSAANATAPVPPADAPSAAGPALPPAPGNSSSNTTAVQIHLHITGSDIFPFTNATESAVLAALEQATNGSNSSVTINGYTLSIGAPTPGTALTVSGPAPSPAVSDTHTRRRLLMSTKSGGLGYKGACPSAWQQLWHQILGSAGSSLKSHGQGLLALGQYLRQMPRQAWWAASNPLSSRVLGHSVKSAAQNMVHAYATVLYQRANQVLVSLLRIKGVMQASVAEASDRAGRLGGRGNWRMLASSDDNGVDIDVTVDVPSGQDGPAAQNSIEGPGFAPALQQSLNSQGINITAVNVTGTQALTSSSPTLAAVAPAHATPLANAAHAMLSSPASAPMRAPAIPPASAPTPSISHMNGSLPITTPNAAPVIAPEASVLGLPVPALAPALAPAVPNLAPGPSLHSLAPAPAPLAPAPGLAAPPGPLAAPAPAPMPGSSMTPSPLDPAPAPSAMAAVLFNVTEYQDVRNAPASWNSSAYSTATLQLTVTNTSVAAFDNVTQTALLNAINSYLVADGYNNTYLGLSSISSVMAVVQAPSGTAASAPADGLPPGLSVSVTVAPTNSSVAAPLVVGAAPSLGRRHLLAATVISKGTGVDTNVTTTAPAAELSNITSLLQLAVSSGALQQQLHNAGVNIGLTRASVEAVEPGLPDTGNDAGQQQSRATATTAHKAGIPIVAVAGAAAGGLVALLIAVACCWVCARKRAERKRHAALGGKVPAALPDIEQPPAQESAAVEQAETEQPTKPLQEGQPMSHPVEQFKMPVGPPAPNLFRQSLRQTILEPISRLNSRTSSIASSRRSCVCVRPPDLAHRRLQEEEEETAIPLPAHVIAAAAPKKAKASRPARYTKQRAKPPRTPRSVHSGGHSPASPAASAKQITSYKPGPKTAAHLATQLSATSRRATPGRMPLPEVLAALRARGSELDAGLPQQAMQAEMAAFLGSQLPEGLLFGEKYVIQQARQRNGSAASVLAHQAPAACHGDSSEQEDPTEVSIKFVSNLDEFGAEQRFYSSIPTSSGNNLGAFVPRLHDTIIGSNTTWSGEHHPPAFVLERGHFSLEEWLADGGGWEEEGDNVKYSFFSMTKAVEALHNRGIVHREVVPASFVWFGDACRWKLVNFRHWTLAGSTCQVRYSLRYAAPEVVAAAVAGPQATMAPSPAADMWALGVLGYEMMTGQPLFGTQYSNSDVIAMLLGYRKLPFEANLSCWNAIPEANARFLIQSLLRPKPQERATASALLASPMLAGMELLSTQ
ncbi:hypothetical protein WJX77_004480 [Trebouxia sp. C0004]